MTPAPPNRNGVRFSTLPTAEVDQYLHPMEQPHLRHLTPYDAVPVVVPREWAGGDNPILHRATCSEYTTYGLTEYGVKLIRRLANEGCVEVGMWDGTDPVIVEDEHPGDVFYTLEFDLEPLL